MFEMFSPSCVNHILTMLASFSLSTSCKNNIIQKFEQDSNIMEGYFIDSSGEVQHDKMNNNNATTNSQNNFFTNNNDNCECGICLVEYENGDLICKSSPANHAPSTIDGITTTSSTVPSATPTRWVRKSSSMQPSDNEKCNHIFHLECIMEWLMKKTAKGKCPLCRQTFVSMDGLEDKYQGSSRSTHDRWTRILNRRNNIDNIGETAITGDPNDGGNNVIHEEGEQREIDIEHQNPQDSAQVVEENETQQERSEYR